MKDLPEGEQQKLDEAAGIAIRRFGPPLVEKIKAWAIPLLLGFTLGGGGGTVISNVTGHKAITGDTVRAIVHDGMDPFLVNFYAHEIKDSLFRDSLQRVAQQSKHRWGPSRASAPQVFGPYANNQRRNP